jgi:hypothetical protein
MYPATSLSERDDSLDILHPFSKSCCTSLSDNIAPSMRVEAPDEVTMVVWVKDVIAAGFSLLFFSQLP